MFFIKIQKKIVFCNIILFVLYGCSTPPPPETTPVCPNFGQHCRKVPINTWDTQTP